MKHLERDGLYRSGPPRSLLLLLVASTVTISVAAALVFDGSIQHQSLFSLSNLVGPTAQSLLRGQGLTVCTTQMGTPGHPICFHAARMPLPSLVVAAGVRLFGDAFLRVALFKTLLFLVPLELSIWLVWRQMPVSRWRRSLITLLLFAPFAMTSFLANVVNLQVEEGYACSLLAASVAFISFGPATIFRQAGWIVSFAVMVDGLYLSKSSLLLAAVVLTFVFFLRLRLNVLRSLLVFLTVAAPAGWAIYQHHASGRFSLGTSLDGMNLHKGNAGGFLEHYPPPAGSSLDRYDANLNRSQTFSDEWSFDAYHRRAAITYIRTHPVETVRGDVLKAFVLLVSLKKYGSSESHGLQLALETAGLLLFRMIFVASIMLALFSLVRKAKEVRDRLRTVAAAYLALVAACVLPYIAGFAYTRHGSVLIYPACLMCCRALCNRDS